MFRVRALARVELCGKRPRNGNFCVHFATPRGHRASKSSGLRPLPGGPGRVSFMAELFDRFEVDRVPRWPLLSRLLALSVVLHGLFLVTVAYAPTLRGLIHAAGTA